MQILLIGLILLLSAFLIHFAFWRIFVPKRQVKALLIIFFGTLAAGLLLIGLSSPQNSGLKLVHPSQYLHICVFYIAVTFLYINAYTAVCEESPSLVMTLLIASRKHDGIDNEGFKERISDDIFIKPRIKIMISDGLIELTGEKFKLTKKGYYFTRLILFFRMLMNDFGKGC